MLVCFVGFDRDGKSHIIANNQSILYIQRGTEVGKNYYYQVEEVKAFLSVNLSKG